MPAPSQTHPHRMTANEENALKKYAAVLIVQSGLAVYLGSGVGVATASADARDA